MDVVSNYEKVKSEVEEACREANRDPNEVLLLPVSKTKPIEMLESLYDAKKTPFGENHVQEIVEKSALHPEYEFHMIGHLQTNKVNKVVGKVKMIHSVDSQKLAREISKEAVKKGLIQDILVEINCGDEATKQGFSFAEAESEILAMTELPGISVKGLMCVAPYTENPEENRPLFARMRELLVDINLKISDNSKLNVLSMGMSNDYHVAIQEGATIVRIGTSIFGPREYKGV